MLLEDAIELFQQYILVEKGLSKLTFSSYMTDLKKFFEYFKDGGEEKAQKPMGVYLPRRQYRRDQRGAAVWHIEKPRGEVCL